MWGGAGVQTLSGSLMQCGTDLLKAIKSFKRGKGCYPNGQLFLKKRTR